MIRMLMEMMMMMPIFLVNKERVILIILIGFIRWRWLTVICINIDHYWFVGIEAIAKRCRWRDDMKGGCLLFWDIEWLRSRRRRRRKREVGKVMRMICFEGWLMVGFQWWWTRERERIWDDLSRCLRFHLDYVISDGCCSWGEGLRWRRGWRWCRRLSHQLAVILEVIVIPAVETDILTWCHNDSNCSYL